MGDARDTAKKKKADEKKGAKSSGKSAAKVRPAEATIRSVPKPGKK